MNKRINTNEYIPKVLDRKKNVVSAAGYTFRRHPYAYTNRLTLSTYNNLYVELHQGATTDCIADIITKFKTTTALQKHRVVVSTSDKVSKAPQFHSPVGYIIIAKYLNKTVIQRVQELLRFGHTVRIITDNHNELFKSEYSLQSELDDVYYALDRNPENRVKQSPFLCELEGTYNAQGAKILQELREQHNTFVFNYVYDLTAKLYQIASEESRETRYERAARNVYYSNYYYDQYLKHPKASIIKARLDLKAKAYGFSLKLDEDTPTIDKFQPAEYIFSKKPTATGATSETIWDTGSVDKALVSVRQKQKISELPTSNRDLYEIIEAIKWFEDNGTEQWYLDQENTYKCICGFPAQLTDYRCIACDAKNPHYLPEFTTEENAILDQRIEEMQQELAATLVIRKERKSF